jgi:hypothetical protein
VVAPPSRPAAGHPIHSRPTGTSPPRLAKRRRQYWSGCNASSTAPLGGTPLVCWRVLRLAAEAAAARGQELGPERLLVGLLRDAQEPLETALDAHDRRLRGLLGLLDRGPHPIRLLVEARGLALANLLAAVLRELDQVQ